MELSDLLLKIANRDTLTPQEKDALARYGKETQQRNSFVAGLATPDNKLNINFPFYPMFSEVLPFDKNSVEFPVSGGYKHLLLFNSVRSTNAGTTNAAVCAEINGDTGNNYDYQGLFSYSSTVTGSAGLNVAFLNIGTAIPDGQNANIYGSAMTFIMNYQGAQYKTSQTLSYFNVHTLNPATNISSCIWYNTDPIQKLRIYANSGNTMKAGSAISCYGLM